MILDAWGWCTGTTQRDDMGREEGSGWGTHVYLWQIHFDIWQNQYNIVKLEKKRHFLVLNKNLTKKKKIDVLLHILIFIFLYVLNGLPRWQVVKNLPPNAGVARDGGSISGLGRTSGVGNGNPLQYSCLKNPMDREALRAAVHGVAKSQT